jgi:hypothetical protein
MSARCSGACSAARNLAAAVDEHRASGLVLNCGAHDIPVLVAARLLKSLGNPPQDGVKFFASVEILELAKLHVGSDSYC